MNIKECLLIRLIALPKVFSLLISCNTIIEIKNISIWKNLSVVLNTVFSKDNSHSPVNLWKALMYRVRNRKPRFYFKVPVAKDFKHTLHDINTVKRFIHYEINLYKRPFSDHIKVCILSSYKSIFKCIPQYLNSYK